VKAIRERQGFENCRVRYKILGERFRPLVLRRFESDFPDIHAHILKRSYFLDYLFLTGIFNSLDLD